MKKHFIFMAVLALILTGCDDHDADYSATLVIRNQTFSEITNVIWNGVEFGNIAIGGTETKIVPSGSASINFTRAEHVISARTSESITLVAGERREFSFINTTPIISHGQGFPSGLFGTLGISAPDTPTGVTATAHSTSEIRINWNAVTGATGYRVEFTTTEGGEWYVVPEANNVTGTSATHTGLSSYTTRWYRVIAFSSVGDSIPSATVFATTQLPLPAAPTGVTAVAILSGSIRIEWNAVSDAVSYRVQFATTATGAWADVLGASEVTENFAIHSGLPSGVTRWYRVFARNSGGDSPASSTVSAMTRPAVPAGITVTGLSPSEIRVNWNAVTGATGYRVEFAETNSGTWVNVPGATSVTGTTATHSGLPANSTRWYRVFAFNGAGDSEPSAAMSAFTMLNAPSGVTASAISTSEIRITWNSVQSAVNYRVQFATTATGTFSDVPGASSVTGTSVTHSGLPSGASRWYRITALNAQNQSPPSETVSAMVIPATPTGVTATGLSPSQIRINWSVMNGANGYRVEFAASASDPWTFLTSVNVNTATDPGLTANTTRWYRIIAFNSAGESEPSMPVSARSLIAALPAPTSVTVTELSATSVSVTWSAVSGVTSYKVYRSGGTAGNRVLRATIPGTTYTDTGLALSTGYSFIVTSLNADSVESADSMPVPFATIPAAPTNLTNYGGSISWSSASLATGVTGYRVYYATSLTGQKILVAENNGRTNNTTTHDISGLTPLANTTYTFFYWVTAIREGRESAYSTPITRSVTTPPIAPPNLRMTANTVNSVTVAWDAVPGATNYRLELVRRSGGGWMSFGQWTIPSTQRTFTITGMVSGWSGFVWVTALNANTGLSSYSEVSVWTR